MTLTALNCSDVRWSSSDPQHLISAGPAVRMGRRTGIAGPLQHGKATEAWTETLELPLPAALGTLVIAE